MLPYSLWCLVSWACILLLPAPSAQAGQLGERSLPTLAPDDIALLVITPDPVKNIDPHNPRSHLSKILIPRPPDTDNNTQVRQYIVKTLKDLNWHVEEDAFEDNTPYGRKKFTNVIATKDPQASRRVVLSAHFDSKFYPTYPENQFVGATDSAAPCAMMLDLAEALNPLLDRRIQRVKDGELDDDDDLDDMTLQLVFFDGEEAFKDWTDTDSIYGARHLAEKWATTYVQPNQKRRLLSQIETELSSVEHLILLDLLGAEQPRLRSYFIDTAWMFDALVDSERRLGESGAFAFGDSQSMAPGKWKSYFQPRIQAQWNYGYIGDDHVPFLHKGVPILHLIAEPFPHVWHKLSDNADALDIPTMRRWNLILRVFMCEYLHLQPKDMTRRSEETALPVAQRSVSELPRAAQ